MTMIHPMNRRKLMLAGAGGLASMALQRHSSSAASKPVLVELFTSQGCSSCPPADELAGRLARDPDVIVLSFNVDYWDYLGWRDTLAKPEFSQRQYDYARSRGDGAVYTPQMIINGTAHAVGSNQHEVAEQIAQAQPFSTRFTLSLRDKEIHAEIAAQSFKGDATLWLMAVAAEVRQDITRGENAGKSITYYNVVRNLVPAAMWQGEELKASWMRSAIMTPDCKFCVAVLQQGKTGPVLGVARA